MWVEHKMFLGMNFYLNAHIEPILIHIGLYQNNQKQKIRIIQVVPIVGLSRTYTEIIFF